MMKLKWYECSSYKDLPDGIKGIRLSDGFECFDFVLVDQLSDIIAYTLGEPLEGGE